MTPKRVRYFHVFLKRTWGTDFITRAIAYERLARGLVSHYYNVDELPRYKVMETQI